MGSFPLYDSSNIDHGWLIAYQEKRCTIWIFFVFRKLLMVSIILYCHVDLLYVWKMSPGVWISLIILIMSLMISSNQDRKISDQDGFLALYHAFLKKNMINSRIELLHGTRLLCRCRQSLQWRPNDHRKHKSSASLAFVGGFTADRWIPRKKGH